MSRVFALCITEPLRRVSIARPDAPAGTSSLVTKSGPNAPLPPLRSSLAAGLAVPVSTVRDVRDQLDGSGKATHGWMGVVCAKDPADTRPQGGAVVQTVMDGKTVRKGGLYVFDRYMFDEAPEVPEREALARDLESAGFGEVNVERALDWLADLAGERSRAPLDDGTPRQRNSLRLYSPLELTRLSVECRGLLLSLENADILNPGQRELVIDRLLALDLEHPVECPNAIGKALGIIQAVHAKYELDSEGKGARAASA